MAFIAPIAAAIAPAAGLISAGVGIFGAVRQGQIAEQQAQSQAGIAKYNAAVARNNAIAARQAAEAAAKDKRLETSRRISTIRATFAAGGVVTTEGSPLLVQSEQAAEGALEAARILHRGNLQAQGYESQSLLDETQSQAYLQQGKSAKTASYLDAIGEGIGGLKTLAPSSAPADSRVPVPRLRPNNLV